MPLITAMEKMFREIFEHYRSAKKSAFAGNVLARKFRGEFPRIIESLLQGSGNRYKISASSGKGNWTDCPWIAILDKLVTETPQSGYYPVFLFKADMTGVYLSLNQGITDVRDIYKKNAKNVLKRRAEDFRLKLNAPFEYLNAIDLRSDTNNARLYEAGNILAKLYPIDSFPDADSIKKDIFEFIGLYNKLIFNSSLIGEQFIESKSLSAIEKKQLRLHFRIERNSSLPPKVKKEKGYICEVCGFDFQVRYGDLGTNFIEVHHLKPISTLTVDRIELNMKTDFAVLCSNCHRMIHKLKDPSNILMLKRIVLGRL